VTEDMNSSPGGTPTNTAILGGNTASASGNRRLQNGASSSNNGNVLCASGREGTTYWISQQLLLFVIIRLCGLH
jgi:hypothetical protein